MPKKEIAKDIEKALRTLASLERAKTSSTFFKIKKGQYGEGDIFLGVTVPETRKVAKEFLPSATLGEVVELLHSPYHEVRLAGTHLFVLFYRRASLNGNEKERASIAKAYIKNAKYFNNWDLVDASASQVLGEELACFSNEEGRKKILDTLIKSKNLWENRIAVVSQYSFIKRISYTEPLSVIERSLLHPHDLMHKANGWMLREIGKFSGQKVLDGFLDKHGAVMPRTTLRYALEHYDTKKRELYMKMKNQRIS